MAVAMMPSSSPVDCTDMDATARWKGRPLWSISHSHHKPKCRHPLRTESLCLKAAIQSRSSKIGFALHGPPH